MIGDIERVDDEFIMFPQQNETVCRISSFEPDKKYQNVASDSASYFSDLDAGDTLVKSKRHPFMHKSKTVDYAIILEGEITLLLDNEEVTLSEGDIVIQRGTNHAWVNNSDSLCRICFILMGAKAVKIEINSCTLNYASNEQLVSKSICNLKFCIF